MAIRGKPGLEVGELPGGGEEVDVATMAISGEPGLEVGEAPGGGEKDVVSIATSAASQAQRLASPLRPGHFFTSSSAHSGSPFSPSARGGDSSIKSCSSASKVLSTASQKDSKAVPAFRSRSKKMKNRRKKGDGARNSMRLPRIVLHQHILHQKFPFGFASSVLRGAGALF
jgi:hypothetical protein